MTNTVKTGPKGAGEAAALPTADARQLRDTITLIDAISQEGCERIGTIARLLLIAMETQTFYKSPEVMAGAIDAISYIAAETQSAINAEAEARGADWTDADAFRRAAAYNKFRDGGKQ